ncbi:MAG TPA: ABC transporter permease [Trueperaceae bacterium]|nr:ABC transporter permease [Trueperaceae bacterium]
MSTLVELARRALQLLLVLWAIATILFLIFRLMPGNPLAAYIEPTFSLEQQQELLQTFGLDKSLPEQYVIYLRNLVRGDLGVSFTYRRPVRDVIASVFPNTVVLTISALLVSYLIGTVWGALMGWFRGRRFEKVSVPLVLIGRAAPEFWVGMILLAVFSFGLGWFPSGGANTAGAQFGSELERFLSLDFWTHLFLPALSLGLYLFGMPALLMRSSVLEVVKEDYVTVARSKGLSDSRVLFKHVSRNAMFPVVTAFALGIGYSIGGNVVIETVFSWPGLGRLLVRAVSASDYPLAQGAFFLIALVIVIMNFLADLTYRLLDPRVKNG